MGKFWQVIAQYIGLPLVQKLVEAISTFVKDQYAAYKRKQEFKRLEKENAQKAKEYAENDNPQPSDHDSMP